MREKTNLCEIVLAALPERVLVGVSGGVDSVALLHALVRTGRKPTVLHFDHGWRAESSADADWVRCLAAELGVKCIVGKMGRRKAKREALAREARYAFFARAIKRIGVPDLVLAHHADDQVETFFMQLLRGVGSAARGMDSLSKRDGLVIYRPWLGLWRKDILAYSARRKLAWREDPTNVDTAHRRNLIRHRVLPYLRRQVSANVAENLWRAAEILRAESAWLDELCADAAGKSELAVKALCVASVGQQRRTILRWLQQRGVAEIGFFQVEAVRGLLQNDSPAKINLSTGKFARRRTGRIFVEE